MKISMRPIARIETVFSHKFGIPRQSGLTNLPSRIVFEKEYQNPDALKGLSEYSHIWLIWYISEHDTGKWSPTVRPPRLGGRVRKGVFASRSPHRPNPIGISCVRLLQVESHTKEGPVITVEGADLLDGTPILDIKPYVPYSDSFPDAEGSFASSKRKCKEVILPKHLAQKIPEHLQEGLVQTLSQDPRPGYADEDDERHWSFLFADWDIHFRVQGETAEVIDIQEKDVPNE
jgi:tRNA-Thr(GGU) m(6)t(6)A37 methyltransferase TsaA